MSGTGEDVFSPNGTLTVAEAIMTTVRLADRWVDGSGEVSQTGSHWYDNAVDKAIEPGIVTRGQFDSYDRPATRA